MKGSYTETQVLLRDYLLKIGENVSLEQIL